MHKPRKKALISAVSVICSFLFVCLATQKYVYAEVESMDNTLFDPGEAGPDMSFKYDDGLSELGVNQILEESFYCSNVVPETVLNEFVDPTAIRRPDLPKELTVDNIPDVPYVPVPSVKDFPSGALQEDDGRSKTYRLPNKTILIIDANQKDYSWRYPDRTSLTRSGSKGWTRWDNRDLDDATAGVSSITQYENTGFKDMEVRYPSQTESGQAINKILRIVKTGDIVTLEDLHGTPIDSIDVIPGIDNSPLEDYYR